MKKKVLYYACKYISYILLAMYLFNIPKYLGFPRYMAMLTLFFVLISQLYIFKVNKNMHVDDKMQAWFTKFIFIVAIIMIAYEGYMLLM